MNIYISDKLLFCKERNVDYNLRKNDSLDLVSMYSRTNTFKAGVHLNGIFAPLYTGLLQISRWHFKQSKNSMLKT